MHRDELEMLGRITRAKRPVLVNVLTANAREASANTLKSLLKQGLVRIVAHPIVKKEDGEPAQAIVPTVEGVNQTYGVRQGDGRDFTARTARAKAIAYGENDQ